MKKTIIFGIFYFFAASVCFASSEQAHLNYRCFSKKSKEPRWEAFAQVVKTDSNEPIYEINEEAKGVYSGYEGEITRKTIVFYEDTADDNYRPLKGEIQFFDKDNKLILREIQEYDYKKNKVYIEGKDFLNNKERKGELEICGQMTNKLVMMMQIRKFLKSGEKFEPLYFVSSKPALYKMNLKILKEEEVDFNDKKIKAYKIKLDPDVGMLNFLKFLLKDTYVWFNVDKPYELVKFEGLETDLGSERVIVETKTASFND